MDDLVRRLRCNPAFFKNGAAWLPGSTPDQLSQEAADEIERLRGLLKLIYEITARRKKLPKYGRSKIVSIAGRSF